MGRNYRKKGERYITTKLDLKKIKRKGEGGSTHTTD